MEIKTNDKFPGLTGYTGPARGYFSVLHHAGPLVEWSENVFERIDFIEKWKLGHERAIRKSHIVYLDPLEIPAIAKLKLLSEDYWPKRKRLDADYWAKRTTLDEYYATKRKLMGDDYWAKWATLYADHRVKGERLSDAYWVELRRLDHDYEAERKPLYDEIIRYLQPLIPDWRWDGTEIKFD